MSLKRNRNFWVIFPQTYNVHLTKDVGFIPFVLSEHYNYNSVLATYNNGPYNAFEGAKKGIKIKIINKWFSNELFDVLWLIIQNIREIDLIQVYHFGLKTLIWLSIAKICSFGRIKTYMKLDTDNSIESEKLVGIRGAIARYLFLYVDLITVESTPIHGWLLKNWNKRVEYLPNGYYDEFLPNEKLPAKENTILTVGRIGTEQKATEILCEAFALVHKYCPGWTLEIVGPILPTFTSYIEKFYSRFPELINKVFFKGEIKDRKRLKETYNKALIFVLTSRWESFGLVYLEALSSGCYIITSNIPPAIDITRNGEIGSLFPVDDVNCLANILKENVNNIPKLINLAESGREYAKEKFHWNIVCKQLLIYLKEKVN